MADFDNFSEINENFDTIKTLLNSIRAQGILNTSDVDKLLSGINTKLEKLNTEEDIDLIKIFLSELKQNFEERHGVLVSKFAAIESLFSNLLKNSSEMPKSSELKELFDIVATNLSVFSREVVSQKESLTEISLRLDAMRSDDTQKREIIKNISILKSDLERLSNGFDSIVISLNDNFKTVVKTIASIDKTEYLDKFSDSIANIEMSSNTVLSALQLLGKKTEQVEDALINLATKDDINTTNQKLFEIVAQSHEVAAYVSELSDRYTRLDNLTEKIDASVNIIATLKAVMEENEDKNAKSIIEELKLLEADVKSISEDTKFEEFKLALEGIFRKIVEGAADFEKELKLTNEEIAHLSENLKELNIKNSIINISDKITLSEDEIKRHINETSQKSSTLQDANITRVLNDINSSADFLSAKLNQTQSSIAIMCEKNFGSIYENITELKGTVAQLDENTVSANNAIFSNITDRLTVFENSLRASLETQEQIVSSSSAQLVEQIENIKNLSGVLDYKIDSSVVEVGNVKREFSTLRTAVENVLALDFVNTVKDLRVDLYASKQELVNHIESSNNDLADKFTNDLYGKYELLISKLDTVEDELKSTQSEVLSGLKPVLENITSSLVDILSYVSERHSDNSIVIESRLDKIDNSIKENSVAYVENVRNIVDIIRVQVENNLKNLEEENSKNLDLITTSIKENSQDLKNDIKYSYSKLLEIQDLYNEIKEIININSVNFTDKFDGIITSTDDLKAEFETKIIKLKNSIFDKIAEFKQEFTFDNAEKVNELKFSVENLYSKGSTEVVEFLNNIKEEILNLSSENSSSRTAALAKILENISSLKSFIESTNSKSSDDFEKKVSEITQSLANVRETLENIDENIDADITRQLSIVESNFETLMSQITILFDKSELSLSDKISLGFSKATETMNNSIVEKLDEYRICIEKTFESLESKALSQSESLQKTVYELNQALKDSWTEQATINYNQINEMTEALKALLNKNTDISAEEHSIIKEKLAELLTNTSQNNEIFIEKMQSQLNSLKEQVSCDLSNQDNRINEVLISSKDISASINSNHLLLEALDSSLAEKFSTLKTLTTNVSAEELQAIDTYVNHLQEEILTSKKSTEACKDLILQFLQKELSLISQNVEKETDVIVSELVEQFDILKKNQDDEIVDLTSRIDDIVSAHIYNNIEDIKAYLDVKTDSSNLITKVDYLKMEMTQSISDVLNSIGKMLDAGVFNTAIKDFRTANEILINSSIDRINEKIDNFINENKETLDSNASFVENKLDIFSKKTTDLIVEKFEEIKVFSQDYSESLAELYKNIDNVLVEFATTKSSINNKIDELSNNIKTAFNTTNKGIEALTKCFADLQSQISSKSFDEAFQASINKQIGELEKLLSEQLGYIEDINELCANNLPDVTELNTLVKHSILDSIDKFSDRIENVQESVSGIETIVEQDVKELKSELITQILNVFNQISFVAEEEEILDFIQDKHDELITILSHIVTSTNDIYDIKKDVTSVDKKVTTIKDEIKAINNKINSIISANGDVDYIYSLHDLEADIANLRLALNEVKENNYSNEFTDLINSTNEIYTLVETIKDELPSQKAIDGIAEDIVSISTRTNKLILASDESYKTLQENLQEFKLVIDDLDERTRNFAQESGLDRIDSKLNAINTMMVNGSKTNQVFNQVFEYLAEWVDNASVQINSISDKVETLDDISQIKTMLAEIKSDAADNTETEELIEALGTVFNKQTKRISSLETKLDRIIVDNTINKDRKIDMTPLEDTLNRFLVSIDEKMISQQQKIDSLEAKLETLQADKETAQLTKKVGGMDRQIAKLNKSIEKIASHVIDK